MRLHRRGPSGDMRLQRLDPDPGVLASPEPDGVLPNTERLADLVLVQPSSVKSIDRARSDSARSQEPAKRRNSSRCFSVAVTGDLPVMIHLSESIQKANHSRQALATLSKPA